MPVGPVGVADEHVQDATGPGVLAKHRRRIPQRAIDHGDQPGVRQLTHRLGRQARGQQRHQAAGDGNTRRSGTTIRPV